MPDYTSGADGEGISFADIENLAILKRFQTNLYHLTGLVFDFVDTEGRSSGRLKADKNFTDFCRLINSTSSGLKDCRDCDMRYCEKSLSSKKPILYSCHLGLKEICVPLVINGSVLGFLTSGQFLLSSPTKSGYERIRKKIEEYGITHQKAKQYYQSLPVVGSKKAEAITDLISIISEYIVEAENRIMELKKAYCKDRMEHAREFIKLNYKEQLTISDVASAVFLSSSRFSHIFKERFNTTFTSYISELRIKEAKNLLSNTDLQVIEIAFQSGFGNLSHFNHVFREKTGFSPSQYRKKRNSTS